MKQLFGISFTSLNHTFAWLTFKLCSDSLCFFFWNNCFNNGPFGLREREGE